MAETAAAGTGTGTGRTEAFSDGVFAIAITLLVLDIRTPTATELHDHGGSLVLALLAEWPTYVSYLATFFAVGTVWLNHHAFFGRLARVDATLQWWNLVLLLGVSFTPFPTALVAEYLGMDLWDEHARVAAAVYALVFALGTVPWLFLSSHLVTHPGLLAPPFDADTARRERRRGIAGVAAYTALVSVAVLVPIGAVAAFLAAGVFFAVTARGLPGTRAGGP